MITIKDRTENVGKWSTHDVTEHEEIKRDEIEYLQMSVGVMRDQLRVERFERLKGECVI